MFDSYSNFSLFTHRNPDGDAIGSILALGTWLENQGKIVTYHISTPISKIFDFLEKTKIIKNEFDYRIYDQIIFLDSANPIVMFEHFWVGHEEYFANANTLCIDHHRSNTGYARENIIHPEIGSTCELLTKLLEQRIPGSLTPEIATYLYLGISTDTGHFMHATTSETHRIIGTLIDAGADTSCVSNNIYKSKTLESLSFNAQILQRAKKSGKILWTRVDYDEITHAGIDREEAKEALYQLQEIKRDGIVAYFEIRKEESIIRCSLRTNEKDIDVSSICSSLDPCGGGHRAAAGCKLVMNNIENPLPEIERYVERMNGFLG